MRQERDALGDLELPDEAYFGIATTRLIDSIAIDGPGFPPEIPCNVIRVRQAQAIVFGRNNYWNRTLAASVQNAAARLAGDEKLLRGQLKTLPVHGGGARSVMLNLDEVLANLAIEEMGSVKGEYHKVSPLFQLDSGTQPLTTYMTAVHITLIKELFRTCSELESLMAALKQQEQALKRQETISQMNFQQVALSTIGADFERCHESLSRCRQQLEWFRTRLIPCWQGPAEVLPVLRELVGIDLVMCQSAHDFPWNVDLYVGVTSLLKTTAVTLLQFCNRMRYLIGVSKEIEMPRLRANPAFNPTGKEFLVLDTVSQMAFLTIGSEAAIVAAAGMAQDGAGAYAPMITAQMIWCGKWMTKSLQLLSQKFAGTLTGNPEAGKNRVASTPLQAETLIPALGYERAVQVARISALTEKPVRMVVSKMKLMTEEQLNHCLPEVPSADSPDMRES
ncbi:MAG: hypothetical protein AB9917_20395 [Negativicutes bacterium]